MPAPNDDFAGAILISGAAGSVTTSYDAAAAGTEPGEPSIGSGHTVWWKWVAPSTGAFQFDTNGSTRSAGGALDTLLAVYTGTAVNSLTQLAVDDDAGAGPNSLITFTATASTTYYLQVDLYSADAGTLHLNWAVPPPPAPTATTWTDTTSGRPTQTMFGGDDIVVAGTHLDTITAVTIGGFPQVFTINSSTQLTIHVGDTARDGQVVVSNSTGSATASNNSSTFAVVRFLGPWTSPHERATEDGSDFTNGASAYGATTTSSTQPATLDGDPTTGTQGAFFILGASGGGANPTTDITWDVRGTVVVLDERFSTYTMPDYNPTAEIAADPTAVGYETNTADVPVPTSDLTITFDPQLSSSGGEYDEDSNGRTLAEDLWQMRVQYRRLDDTDWYFDGSRPKFVGDVWPSGLTSKTLDFDRLARNPVDMLDVSSAGVWTDNRASLIGSTHYGYAGAMTIPWADFGTARAWAVTFDALLGGPAITAPVVDPDPMLRTGSVKLLQGIAFVRGTWTYQPRRYRLIYTAPPPSVAVHTLRRRQQAAPVGSAPRRRQTASRAGSPRRGPGATA